MSNSIALFKNYINLLDEVYKQSALTADLESSGAIVRAGNAANEIVIPKISMDGLADYSRNGGYVKGDVTLTQETVQFNYDRGRKFSVDAMDDEETAGVAFGQLAAEFIRTKVVPEMDAFRFAKYASASGAGSATGTLSAGADVITALRACVTAMDEAEVPMEQRILYITPTLHGLVTDLDTTKSREVLARFSKIIDVPQTRFYTAIDLLDGTTDGQEAGGYAKASGGKDINFLAIHAPAVIQYTKHTVNKAISPDENQDSVAWLFFYRAYGLALNYANKAAGIYCHHKA